MTHVWKHELLIVSAAYHSTIVHDLKGGTFASVECGARGEETTWICHIQIAVTKLKKQTTLKLYTESFYSILRVSWGGLIPKAPQISPRKKSCCWNLGPSAPFGLGPESRFSLVEFAKYDWTIGGTEDQRCQREKVGNKNSQQSISDKKAPFKYWSFMLSKWSFDWVGY